MTSERPTRDAGDLTARPDLRPSSPERDARKPKSRGSLQRRLTLINILVSLPLLIGLTTALTLTARTELENDADRSLRAANQMVVSASSLWLDSHVKALNAMASNPAMQQDDAGAQKAVLETMATNYEDVYLASTTDLKGFNIARSDQDANKDYSDRYWFQTAAGGVPVVYETLLGRTTNQPALVISTPIRDPENKIIGVAMFASDLDEVSRLVEKTTLGEGGLAFIVDRQNKLVAHPDRSLTAELFDMSTYPPVAALRRGIIGAYDFRDEQGRAWRAELNVLPNGWGIIAQQPEASLFAPIRSFQIIATLAAFLAAAVLAWSTWNLLGRTIRPIRKLTEDAVAISAEFGPAETTGIAWPAMSGSQEGEGRLDETILLRRAFDDMTQRLRHMIGGLEESVYQRTIALERRAVQLQVTAEVAREAAAIRDLEMLLNNVVRLISERFGFYHAGIFLVGGADATVLSGSEGLETGYAVLRAASSEGGERMLARHHRLRIGQVGIVGYVAASGQPRVALDVGQDAVFFNNPDLPLTRSEMALPLKIEERVIGILDVQSTEPAAFSQEDVAILQVLADQLALAMDNARLLGESQERLGEVQRLLGQYTISAWRRRLADSSSGMLGYRLTPIGLRRWSGAPDLASGAAEPAGVSTPPHHALSFEIELRGQPIGEIELIREAGSAEWSDEERQLMRRVVEQLALSLENARLLDEIQNRAAQEELINNIVANIQRSLNLDAVLRTSVQEIGRALDLPRIQIQVSPGAPGEAR